jgi:hypothetical protein
VCVCVREVKNLWKSFLFRNSKENFFVATFKKATTD